MKTLLWKELRLIGPTFLVGLPLVLSLMYFQRWAGMYGQIWLLVCLITSPLVVFFLGLEPFAKELTSNTFSQLLTQPVPRSRVWAIKAFLSACGITILLLGWLYGYTHATWLRRGTEEEDRTFIYGAVLVAACAHAGGLWAPLFIRQGAISFWVSVTAPAGIMIITEWFTSKSAHGDAILVWVLILYCIAGVLWSRKLFLNAEEIEPRTEVTFWKTRDSAEVKLEATKTRAMTFALLKKEVRLYYVFAGLWTLLGILHLGISLYQWGVNEHYLDGHFAHKPEVKLFLENFWAIWLLFPLFLGCFAIAEERDLGIFESQWCLPIPRWRLMAIKGGVVATMSILLGAIVPSLLDFNVLNDHFHFRPEWLKPGNPGSYEYRSVLSLLAPIWAPFHALLPFDGFPIFILSLVSLALALFGLFASSLSRSFLSTLTPLFLTFLLGGLGFLFLLPDVTILNHPLWQGTLGLFVILPLAVLFLIWRIWINAQEIRITSSLWRRNAVWVLGTLFVVLPLLTSAIYNRFWNRFLPEGPSHNPSDFVLNFNNLEAIQYQSIVGGLVVRLKDGRCWQGVGEGFYNKANANASPPSFMGLLTGKLNPLLRPKITLAPKRTGWLPGADWTSVGMSVRETLGVRSDGSLWIGPTPSEMSKHTFASDWQSVCVSDWNRVYLLKKDGSLWRMEANSSDLNPATKESFSTLTPKPVSIPGTWTAIVQLGMMPYFVDKEGRYWQKAYGSDVARGPLLLDEGLDDNRWVALTYLFSNVPMFRSTRIGITEGGHLMMSSGTPLARVKLSPAPSESILDLPPLDKQLDSSNQWLSLASLDGKAWTLKSDGTLWEWSLSQDQNPNHNDCTVRKIGQQNSWVGLIPFFEENTLALSKDGNIWIFRSKYSLDSHRTFVAMWTEFLPRLSSFSGAELVGRIPMNPGS